MVNTAGLLRDISSGSSLEKEYAFEILRLFLVFLLWGALYHSTVTMCKYKQVCLFVLQRDPFANLDKAALLNRREGPTQK